MEEEGVPSTALREVSLLQMLSESAFIVRYVRRRPRDARRAAPPKTAIVPNQRVFQTDRIDLARSAARARRDETDTVADPALPPVPLPALPAPDASDPAQASQG